MGEMPVLPRPTFRDVILENPLFEKTDEIRSKLEKMPEKDREAFLKDNVDNVWDRVQVIKVANECTQVKEGDFVMCNPEDVLQRGMPIYDGKYIQISENSIKGVW